MIKSGGGTIKEMARFTDKQQQKAKMPAADATQALSAVLQPVGCNAASKTKSANEESSRPGCKDKGKEERKLE